jgi:hypothetical protein
MIFKGLIFKPAVQLRPISFPFFRLFALVCKAHFGDNVPCFTLALDLCLCVEWFKLGFCERLCYYSLPYSASMLGFASLSTKLPPKKVIWHNHFVLRRTKSIAWFSLWL